MENEILERAQNKILKYLASGNKSIAQVKEKLNEYGCSKTITKKILDFLSHYHYIDDELYAKNFVYDSLNLKHYGKIKIQYDLEQKKIPSNIIQFALKNINKKDEIESALDFADKRFNSKITDKNNCDKLKNMLYRRGFSFDIINTVIKKIEA